MNEVVTVSQSILQCSISVIAVRRLRVGCKKLLPCSAQAEPCFLLPSGMGAKAPRSPSQHHALSTLPGPLPYLQGPSARVTNDPMPSLTTVSFGLVCVHVGFGLRSVSAGD